MVRCIAFILGLIVANSLFAQETWTDDLTDLKAWKVLVSDGVELKLTPELHDGRPSMRMDFHFTTGAGYCIAQRPFAKELPENYAFGFGLTSAPGTPVNNLEFKLLSRDASGGEDVWWNIKRSMTFPQTREEMRYKKRHLSFAWGPSGGKQPFTKADAFEIVISSATGGKGTIWIDSVSFKPLPAMKPYTAKPSVVEATPITRYLAENVIDGHPATSWRFPVDTDASITIDLGQMREIGGMKIIFDPPFDTASRLIVETANEAAPDKWVPCFEGSWYDRALVIPIQPIEVRRCRVRVKPGRQRPDITHGIAEIMPLPVECAEDLNALWFAAAEHATPGTYPRYLTGRQSAWTVVGPLNDPREALINEEGMVEVVRGRWSIDPILQVVGSDINWAESTHTQSIGEWPFVTRTARSGISMDIRPSWVRVNNESQLQIEYAIHNPGTETTSGYLHLWARPLQTNPPWQFLNMTGGAGRIDTFTKTDDGIRIDNAAEFIWPDTQPTLRCINEPSGLGIFGVAIRWGHIKSVSDSNHRLSAVATFPVYVEPGKTQRIIVRASVPGHIDTNNEILSPFTLAREKISINVPASAKPILDSVAANLAYILINKDGPGFQPGSRSYERSWIRDGSMTSACMLDFGFKDDVRQFIEWYASKQFPSGKVPCVVDGRGPDPVPEHDSHGQLIYALAEYLRASGDKDFAAAHFGNVEKAVEYIQSQRALRMTEAYRSSTATKQEPGKPPVPLRAFFGLMPESISHEGYSSKPMHSHWDNFFTLRGLRDASFIARTLGRNDLADRWNEHAQDLRRCIIDSIRLTQTAHGIDYIPGCVELGDFDATSTAVAISPCEEELNLPREWLEATFDRYWSFFKRRRDDPTFEWVDYTPYELRVVGAMVRLGHRDRAIEMLDWFMKDQTPQGWHQWAEIVHRDRGAGKWIGDMPHTWVGSDFIRSVRTMLVYEEPVIDASGSNLVLFAGVPAAWLDEPDGVSFKDIHTAYGVLSASLRKKDGWYELRYSGLTDLPRAVKLSPPVAWPPKECEVLEGAMNTEQPNGHPVGTTKELTIRFR